MPATELTAEEWRSIAYRLLKQCEFSITKLKADGWTGLFLIDSEDGQEMIQRHWKEDMMQDMELYPGVKIDRGAVMNL